MMCPPGMGQDLTPQEKVNKEWDGMAGEWDDLAAGYANSFYKVLWKHTGLDPKESALENVVDFGCGTGLLTEKIREVSNHVLALEASKRMAEQVEDKIVTREWSNVKCVAVILSNLESENTEAKDTIKAMEGRADLIVASSVLSFIPEDDVAATLKEIGKMLKPGGIFCHSDWPRSEPSHPDGMTREKSEKYLGMAGLQIEKIEIEKMKMGEEEMDVLVGVGIKS